MLELGGGQVEGVGEGQGEVQEVHLLFGSVPVRYWTG